MSEIDRFDGLVAVVQYRRKEDGIFWHNMAAFDSLGVAEHYCAELTKNQMRPWEYRAIEVLPQCDRGSATP